MLGTAKLPILLCTVLLSVLCPVFAQTVPGGPDRPTLDVVTADILRADSVPGGVEIIAGCSILATPTIDVSGKSTDQALNTLKLAEHGLTWEKKGNAYIVTIRAISSPSLASVNLPEAHLTVRTLWEATNVLLQQQAAQQRLAELKLSEAPYTLGFASINERETRTIFLPSRTLRDQLAALATTFGKGIWRLDQRECGSERTFRLSWIAK
jgi:hypothetical protein